MRLFLNAVATLALLLSGALFGFFYAWVCSTMWGLDAADPRIAIAAMQEMNASVRNPTFGASFFGTAPVLALTAMLAFFAGARHSATGFGAAAGLVLAAVILTMTVNVPMNEALGALPVPTDLADAERIWADYSPVWQIYNITRTGICGVALAAVGYALTRLNAQS